MKLIKYQLMTEANHGTEEEPNIVQTFNNKEIRCKDELFEANHAIAKAEAYGKVTVDDVPDEETEPTKLIISPTDIAAGDTALATGQSYHVYE